MGSLSSSGERSRLPLRCQRRGHLLTAFTICRPIAAPSVSASRTIPRPSPPIPLPPGGNARGRAATIARANFWFWRTLEAATAVAHGPGRPKSKLSCATPSGSHRDHRALSHRCFQMESHRAPPVLRDLQALGRRTVHSYDKMLGFIRNTSTKTGLAVTAYLDRAEYPTGLKPDRTLSLTSSSPPKLPAWNYTIAPNL